MKLEHLYTFPPPQIALKLSSQRMRICRMLARPLDDKSCERVVADIKEHLKLWRPAVDGMRHTSTRLNHKKHALFAWAVKKGDIVGSTCPHFDTLCFQHLLALLHMEMGQYELAEEESDKHKQVFAHWKEPKLAGGAVHPLLFPDFHRAVSCYAQSQSLLASLDVELSAFPQVPYAQCAKTCLAVLSTLNSSRALNLNWGLDLDRTIVTIGSLARGLMALDTIGYEHDGKLLLSRGAQWKEEHFATAISILNLAEEAGHALPALPSVKRAANSGIKAFLEGINRDVYHCKPHPNFEKVFEETVLVKYS